MILFPLSASKRDIGLRLDSLKWERNELELIQHKTGNRAIYPLLEDVGEALKDCILNARPSTTDKEIFLRIKAPHTRLSVAATVGDIYRDCCIAANLPANKRFHNLRRALGTSMVTNGVSVCDVAQVFGDRNINSTKPYLAMDMEHLKICTLPFEGIAPKGGVPRWQSFQARLESGFPISWTIALPAASREKPISGIS